MSLVGEKDSEFGGTIQFEDREKLTNLMRPAIKLDVPTSCKYRASDELSLWVKNGYYKDANRNIGRGLRYGNWGICMQGKDRLCRMKTRGC